MKLLPTIKSHDDIKNLSFDELKELSAELREKIIQTVSENGGHLSPNLGVIELTVALHSVFDFSKDKLIWDVGHQCYTHKLLTGRLDRFDTLRKENGISGFPRREESEFDHFDTGHAGTSISAALGFAAARDMKGEKHDILAVIGDGSMTSGLSFEGLNNAGALGKNLMVILNDNEMSISENVGALSAHLNKIISGETYNKMKKEVDHVLSLIPGIGKQVATFAHRVEEAVKGIIVPGRIFEDFGFKYFGPIDGHNLENLIDSFTAIRKLSGPRIIHVITKKGLGYKPAEMDPGPFHGTSPFEISTGKKKAKSRPTHTSIFGKSLVELAEHDEKIVAITAAMSDGTGLVEFSEKYPDRFFDVGISEQHAVTFAAALAAEGFKPVVAIYSTFLQRAFDQIIHDVCNMNLHVTFAIDRAGIVGDDGPTHQGVYDISFLREAPNMTIMAPKDENELRHMLNTAINHNGPISIRYPRGNVEGIPLEQEFKSIEIGKAELISEGDDILICAIGNTVISAIEAAKLLEKENISTAVINARFAKPLDIKLISKWVKHCGHIITVEENSLMGGFGSGVFEQLRAIGLGFVAGQSIGIPDLFVPHASQESGRNKYGLSAEGIYKKSVELLKSPKNISTVEHEGEHHKIQ